MNLYKLLLTKIQRGKCPSICKHIFLIYSIIMILIIPSFVKERLLIYSFFFDLIIRVIIFLSLYQSTSFVYNFEQSISRFYGGVVSVKIYELKKMKKIFFVSFCILSGLSTYLIFNFMLSIFIPTLGQFSKVVASIFGLNISIPLIIKTIRRDN